MNPTPRHAFDIESSDADRPFATKFVWFVCGARGYAAAADAAAAAARFPNEAASDERQKLPPTKPVFRTWLTLAREGKKRDKEREEEKVWKKRFAPFAM